MRKLLSVFAAFAMALTILTGSIALPLLIRPFYRAQIEPLGIPARSGLTAEQIGAAFDDVMDYCLGKRPDFAAGVLSFSPEGASHFADVRRLFLLDLRVLAVCMAVLLVLYALRRKKGLTLSPLAGHSPGFWAGCGLGGALAIAGVLAALDFDRAFTVFHSIFFPGKDNWLFDPATDPVILILPEAFFRSCAILILAAARSSSRTCAAADGPHKWAQKKRLAAHPFVKRFFCKKNHHAQAWLLPWYSRITYRSLGCQSEPSKIMSSRSPFMKMLVIVSRSFLLFLRL